MNDGFSKFMINRKSKI